MTTQALPGVARRGLPAVLERLWHGLRLRDAVLISIVPLTAVAYAVGSAVTAYRNARDFLDWYSDDITVASAFSAEVRAAVREPAEMAVQQRFDPEARDAGIMRLGVAGRAWDSVLATDADVWDRWAEGQLSYGGTTIPVRVRKRGDFSVHWLTDKRSLSLRTPRDQFYKRFRAIGLSAKTPLESFVANRLATRFDLVAPHTEVVPLFLNNRFFGMYRFVEPVDESFLRPFDRMPGNIFRGDRAARGEYFKGQQRSLFVNPYIWDRAAVSDRPTGAGAGQLRLLLDELNGGGTFENAQKLMARFDRGELARLVAYLLVAGDPSHMDALHNQLLYEDPSTQLLHPIPWDIRLLPLDAQNEPISELMRAWLKDPFVLDAVTQELARAVADSAVLLMADTLAHHAEQRYADYFAYDRRRAGLIPDVGTADAVVGVVRHNVQLLRRWLSDDTVAAGTGSGVLDLEARGRVGTDLVALSTDRPAALRVWRDANLNGVRDASDPEVPLRATGGTRFTLALPVALLAGWDLERDTLVPGHVPYRFFVSGLPAGARLVPELRNRVSGAAAAVVPWPAAEAIRPASAWHPWRYPAPAHRTWRYAGTVRLAETVRIPAGDTLVIAPGTTLRLAPEVSIISRGLVLARGTAAAPIRILDDVPGKPWGTFSLFGTGADGSVVEHADISQGGGALVDRVEYTGMVNLHRVQNVRFDHVFFHDNVRSDDTFHALHSTVTISHSRFLNANGDAIDFDISGGALVANEIDSSANDGIDLMTSTPWIADNVITASRDKGISIGEASTPVIFNNRIVNCVRGIEAKDRSMPLIVNNELVGNGVGIRERRKNWRYGGGPWATILASTFQGNGPVQHDPFSRWTLWDTHGLDSLEESGAPAAPAAADMRWLYARMGVRVASAAAGRVARWDPVAPVAALDQQRFVDDFGAVSDGWAMAGGTTRLEKRDNALVMEVEKEPGSAGRTVSWNLPVPGVVVAQVGGRDIIQGRLVATGEHGEVAVPFAIAPEPFTFRYVVLPLPAGRYTALRVEATPRPGLSHSIQRSTGLAVLRAGRLLLRGYEVYATGAGPAAR